MDHQIEWTIITLFITDYWLSSAEFAWLTDWLPLLMPEMPCHEPFNLPYLLSLLATTIGERYWLSWKSDIYRSIFSVIFWSNLSVSDHSLLRRLWSLSEMIYADRRDRFFHILFQEHRFSSFLINMDDLRHWGLNPDSSRIPIYTNGLYPFLVTDSWGDVSCPINICLPWKAFNSFMKALPDFITGGTSCWENPFFHNHRIMCPLNGNCLSIVQATASFRVCVLSVEYLNRKSSSLKIPAGPQKTSGSTAEHGLCIRSSVIFTEGSEAFSSHGRHKLESDTHYSLYCHNVSKWPWVRRIPYRILPHIFHLLKNFLSGIWSTIKRFHRFSWLFKK